MTTKSKSDDQFKSYGQMNFPPGGPLGAAILYILPSMHPTSKPIVVPLWMYEVFDSSNIMFSILHHLGSYYVEK